MFMDYVYFIFPQASHVSIFLGATMPSTYLAMGLILDPVRCKKMAILEDPAKAQDNGCTFLWNSELLMIPPRCNGEAHLTTCSKVMLLSSSKY